MILDLFDVHSPISAGDEAVTSEEKISIDVAIAPKWHLLADQVYGLFAQMNIVRDRKVILPVNDLLVGFVGRLGAKRRVADEAFEHDGPERPPVAFVSVSLLQEDLRCDVIRSSDCRVSLLYGFVNTGGTCEGDRCVLASGDSLSTLRSDLCLSSSSLWRSP